MWAVAPVDKRRLKEEHVIKMQCTPFGGNKTEQVLTIPSSEDRQSPSTVNEKNIETTAKLSIPQEQMFNPQNEQNYVTSFPYVGNLQMQEYSVGPDNYTSQQSSLIADKSRKQLKSYIGHKAEEIYVYRSLPLGQDRRHNRYWQFITSASQNDPGCGRIFVELHDGRWRLIDSEEVVFTWCACCLLSSIYSASTIGLPYSILLKSFFVVMFVLSMVNSK